MWLALACVVLVGVAAWGQLASNVEQAKYRVVQSRGDIEIRDYAQMIVAEAEVQGERKEAINRGFKIIADYIFGNNSPAQKVAMTAPVIQQHSNKIAMTAPVIQQGGGAIWRVRFVMPSSYTLESLPKPNNQAVKLKLLDSARFAVIRFSGVATEERLKTRTEDLKKFIHEMQLNSIAEPAYAFFNPPWTLPFLRRNEVMIQVGLPPT
jgi:hypothetical protein